MKWLLILMLPARSGPKYLSYPSKRELPMDLLIGASIVIAASAGLTVLAVHLAKSEMNRRNKGRPNGGR